MRRVAAIVFLAVVLAPGAAMAQGSQERDPRPQVVLVGDVDVARGEVAGQVVVVRGTVVVDGVVEGDVIVARGTITVAGQVAGDVVSLSGDVKLGATAQVAGRVVAGGTVEAEPGAQVSGGVTQGVRYTLGPALRALGWLVAPVAFAVSILLLGLVWLWLGPRPLDGIAAVGRSAPLASAGWGVLVAVLTPVAGVALAASVLGLPLGLAIVLGAWLVMLAGLTATTWFIGRLAVAAPRSRVGALFAGWAIASALGLVPFLNVAWWTAGAVFGLGMLVVAVWRARRGPVDAPATGGRAGRHRAGRAPAPATLPGDASDVPPAGLG